MHGVGSGLFEIALAFRGDTFRVVYALQIAHEIWVIHAFQKKSKQGIKTPTGSMRKVRVHRTLGWFGAALAATMAVSGSFYR